VSAVSEQGDIVGSRKERDINMKNATFEPVDMENLEPVQSNCQFIAEV
jgi:hypothetical protein